MRASLFTLFLFAAVGKLIPGEVLPLPQRAADAKTGTVLLAEIGNLPIAEREAVIAKEILAGNVPCFLRRFCAVELRSVIDGREVIATIRVTPDYLAVGSDDDYLLTPLRPATAQGIADRLNCLLPTPRMVDAIWTSAPLKLPPHPLAPGPAMTSFATMAEHSRIAGRQRLDAMVAYPAGSLVAGHKKDVVLAPALSRVPRKVAIYGWHCLDGTPIQPLYTGHTAEWVDYSHGIRLVSQAVEIGGAPRRLGEVLADPQLSPLFSPEGPLRGRY